jgi:hypothetical protein
MSNDEFQKRLARIGDSSVTPTQQSVAPPVPDARHGRLMGFLRGAVWLFAVTFAVRNMNAIDAYFRTHDTLSAATGFIMFSIVGVAIATMLYFAFSLYRTAANPVRWRTHGASALGMVSGFVLGIGPATFWNALVEKLQ